MENEKIAKRQRYVFFEFVQGKYISEPSFSTHEVYSSPREAYDACFLTHVFPKYLFIGFDELESWHINLLSAEVFKRVVAGNNW
jgi:hypothetical protein